MSARAWTTMAICAGAAVLAAQTPLPQRTQPFRSGTDVVLVDVSVRARGKAVTGLTADDFVLTDNGVRQQIESVEATAVPIDLTLVVDVSGNQRGAWEPPPSPLAVGAAVHGEVTRVAALLRPTDRMRVLASDTNVQHVVPMQAVGALPPLRIDGGGLSSMFDTLTAALLQPVEPARRHVVVARTKGIDTFSSVDAAAVRAVAEQSDALFHVVVMETALDNEAVQNAFQCAMMGFCWPSRSFWVPFRRQLVGPRPVHALLRDGQMIAAAAQATGGELHQARVLTEPTLGGTFKKAFEDFRNSYVLRYTLKGVPAGGWHAIEVSVPRGRDYTVKARKGYLVETIPPPVTPPALPERLRSVSDFVTAYERHAYGAVVSSIRQLPDPTDLLHDFQDAGNPWPGNPRREAALVLEMAEPTLFSTKTAVREAGVRAIDRYATLIRHPIEPTQFERYWYFALLATLEGTLRPVFAERFVHAALERFPDEPRFLLMRAINTDQRMASVSGTTTPLTTVSSYGIDALADQYKAAMVHPQTATEARIRLGWFFFRAGKREEALAQLTAAAAQPIPEPALRYLQQLLLGHVLLSLDKPEAAIAAFREAGTISPSAQSARVALMNALLLHGDRQEAEALAQKIQTDTSTDMDPWWMYWQGHYRIQPQIMARLREMSQ